LVVSAESRSEPVIGRWNVEGETLTLSFGENENSKPFTFYQGQFVFPNIPNRRGFWKKSNKQNESSEPLSASFRCALPLR
jgi:hypothetical protein